MNCVIQRVSEAIVIVEGEVIAKIGRGMLLLIAVEREDTEEQLEAAARKIAGLRIFADAEGKMNLALEEVGGEVLAVSQFTLAASLEKGRRPSFVKAEDPERAERLFEVFVEAFRAEGHRVETGRFGAMMQVALVNDGPVTFTLRQGYATDEH
jgi:D-aminoacyl-tRNA deacylase